VVKNIADMILLLECWNAEIDAFETRREKVGFHRHSTLGTTAHLYQQKNTDEIFECLLNCFDRAGNRTYDLMFFSSGSKIARKLIIELLR